MYDYNMNQKLLKNQTEIVGNNFVTDNNYNSKDDVKKIFESYTAQSKNLASDFKNILGSSLEKTTFMDFVMESLVEDQTLSQDMLANNIFYSNYADRLAQLENNSLQQIARESIIQDYSPIVAYAPFFLKNQWVNCVFKDVMMAEVPKSPIINLAYEKRFVRDQAGNEYPIPQVCYDDALMAKLMSEATGIKIDSTKDIPLPFNDTILSTTYIPDYVAKPGAELTSDIRIVEVTITDSASGETYTIPTDIRTDTTYHNFVKGQVKYDVVDAASGAVTKTITDEIVGNVDFNKGIVKVYSGAPTDAEAKITSIKIAGTLANRWNERSLDVKRRVEPIQFVMPESGPRFNTAVTVEESADALATQNVDMIADNIDMAGRTLADFEDYMLRTFLKNSFNAQENAGVGPHGYQKLTLKAKFSLIPYDNYQGRITDWQKDNREFFERLITSMKMQLKNDKVAFSAVMNPQLVRYFREALSWGITQDTSLAGVKLNYQFGVVTSTNEKVNVITSMYQPVEEGVTIIAIPLVNELFTYKYFKYHVVVDRNYRNPQYQLVPNIMMTQRSMAVEVLPVQSRYYIEDIELESPTTLQRS